MRNVGPICTMAALAVAVATPAAAHAQFEGVITFNMHDERGGDSQITEWIKGSKMRVDTQRAEVGSVSILMDGDSPGTSIVMNDRKMVMTMNGDAPMGPAATPVSDLKWAKTGKSETVAGTSCDIYHGSGTVNGTKHESDVCLAKGVGFMVAGSAGRNPMLRMLSRYANLGLGADMGVLKVTNYDSGSPVVGIVATKIEKRSLSASDFAVPAGYQTMQMPMGGMGGGRPPRP